MIQCLFSLLRDKDMFFRGFGKKKAAVKKKGAPKVEEMTVIDAVDNLSSIAEVDIESTVEGIDRSVKQNLQALKDLDQSEKEKTLKTVKNSFKTIHKYLKHVYAREKKDFQDIEIQRGVKAIMILANEAADKLKTCTSLFKHSYREGKLKEIEEYKNLRQFYLNKIVKRFQKVLASEKDWEEEWGTKDYIFDPKKLGLKDLEIVKRDQQYELFQIRQDDGEPFFNRNLLRHIKLVRDFDEVAILTEGEDPLLHINVLVDKKAQKIGEEIRDIVKNELDDFYVSAMKNQDIPVIKTLNKMVMSIFLASNPRNLAQSTVGKTCVNYFRDFQLFLREVLSSSDYVYLTSQSLNEIDQLSRTLVFLVHAFCYAFFICVGKRSDLIDYIHNLMQKGDGGEEITRGKTSNPLTFWNDLLDIYDVLASVLKRYPNGPLFKTLDVFHERKKDEGFDPIYQGNQPSYLYTFSSQSFESKCLRLPCPTFHHHINRAEIIEEFKGYLRYIDQKKTLRCHLLFNLQDHTSWEEHARCQVLEELSRKAEYSNQFILVNLPKKTDFYFQSHDYKDIDLARDFIQLVKEQVALNEECGFFFSKKLSRKEVDAFTKKVLSFIHKRVFSSKKTLSRRERLNFIEIFYQLMILKILDLVKPDYFSFTCKDGIDVGPTTSMGFYAMIKIISQQEGGYTKEEQDYFLWMLYEPSLMVRERLIDYQRLSRVISALTAFNESLQKDQKEALQDLAGLYDYPLFRNISILT